MSGGVPTGPRLDRAAVERIIQRAAELQAGQHDIGDSLTEKELYQLGHDVGIPDVLLRQAVLEERTRMPANPGGLGNWLAGARTVMAARALTGTADRIDAALNEWMSEGELLQIKRRFPQQTSWEPKQGAMASLRRAFGSGRSYALTKAREVVAQVTPLDAGRCHVHLMADLGNTFADRLTAAGVMAGVGGVGTGIGIVVGLAVPVAAVPAALGAVVGLLIARSRRSEVEKVHVALEQILDRLEHGDIGGDRGARGNPLVRIADELLRKGLGPGPRA